MMVKSIRIEINSDEGKMLLSTIAFVSLFLSQISKVSISLYKKNHILTGKTIHTLTHTYIHTQTLFLT